MPSIFSRARTTSSKTAKAAATAAAAATAPASATSPGAGIDEFGRVSSRGGGAPPLPLKDKRSQSLAQSKRATHTSAAEYELDTEVEDGFLPTSLTSSQGEAGGRVYGNEPISTFFHGLLLMAYRRSSPKVISVTRQTSCFPSRTLSDS